MAWIDKVRYVVAVVFLVTYPPAVLYWYLIHPFARFWRRRGPALTYTLVTIPAAAVGFGMYQVREPLLAVRWPFSWPLTIVGLLLYGICIWLEILCRRHLKTSILVGLPELGKDRGRVLSEGPYRRIRHPRYLDLIIGTFGWALVVNYPAIYIVSALMVPALYLVIVLEERELLDRFGAEYEAYMEAVPRRLIPRLGG